MSSVEETMQAILLEGLQCLLHDLKQRDNVKSEVHTHKARFSIILSVLDRVRLDAKPIAETLLPRRLAILR